MTTPAPARPRNTSPPATTETAERDRDWPATTDEAVARIDNALTIISARVDAVDHGATRAHITGQLTAALTVLEQARRAPRSPLPRATTNTHSTQPTRTIPGHAHMAGNHAHMAGKSALKRPTSS